MVLTRIHLWTTLGPLKKGTTCQNSHVPFGGDQVRWSDTLSKELLLAESLVILVNTRSKEILIRQIIYLCCWVPEPSGGDAPRATSQSWGPGKVHRRGPRRHAAGGGWLPGIMGTADGFGWCRVAAGGAGATGGGGSSDRSSSGAAVAPCIRRHAPSAETRRKASGTQLRKGTGLSSGFQLRIK